MDLREIIPGYGKALDREAAPRDAAVLGLKENIGPFSVRSMTLRDYLVLKHHPIFNGEVPTFEALVDFIWFLSERYRPNWTLSTILTRWLFKRRCLKHVSKHYEETFRSALDYVEETVSDFKANPKSGWQAPYYSEGVAYIASFARAFGWSEQETLSKSMKLIVQYDRELRQANGQSLSNLSDNMISNHVLSMRRN